MNINYFIFLLFLYLLYYHINYIINMILLFLFICLIITIIVCVKLQNSPIEKQNIIRTMVVWFMNDLIINKYINIYIVKDMVKELIN